VNSESREAHEKSKSNDGADKVPPIPSDPPPITDIPTRNAKHETPNQTDWQRRHYWMQFAVFLVGVVVAIIYGCQLNEMRKSTNAAARAARAAENSLTFARENAHLDQRAWVAAIDVRGTPQVGKEFEVFLLVKNSGKTFAKEFEILKIVEGVVGGKEPRLDIEENMRGVLQSLRQDRGVSVLAPNSEFTASLTLNNHEEISQTQLDQIKSGQLVIFFHGKMTYRDIFNCPHWTTFCLRLDPSLKFTSCEKGNDADDNRCP
jgi:hypothetical protein